MPRADSREAMCLSGGFAPIISIARFELQPFEIGTQAAVPLIARSNAPVIAAVLIINQTTRFISVAPFLRADSTARAALATSTS